MKKTYFILILLLAGFSSCKEEGTDPAVDPCKSCVEIDKLSQTEGQNYLIVKHTEIEIIANSVTCTDASKWKAVPIGSKVCGGPTGYIAYESSINEANFLAKISEYTKAQATFNKKWGAISDCTIVGPPKTITCVDGKPKFVN